MLKHPAGPLTSVKVSVFKSKYIYHCLVMGVGEHKREKSRHTCFCTMSIWYEKHAAINSNVYFLIRFMSCRSIALCRNYNLMKTGLKNYAASNDGKD